MFIATWKCLHISDKLLEIKATILFVKYNLSVVTTDTSNTLLLSYLLCTYFISFDF